MDWIKEIKSFPKFDIRNVNSDVESYDASKVNSKYKKALDNALNDSVDIAIIELRKLSVLYPESGQIALLLGCCQMIEERCEEAVKSFEKAAGGYVPLDMEGKPEEYLKASMEQADIMKSPDYVSKKTKPIIPSSPAIIEASPDRWKKTKIASERERKDIMKKLNSSQSRQTFVKERRNINWMKVFSFSAGIFLVVFLIYLFSTTVPGAIQGIRDSQQDSAQKLEWLIQRLSDEKENDSNIGRILDEFDEEFFPGRVVEDETTPSPTDPLVTLTPEPDPTPSPTPPPTDSEKVRDASILINEARDIGRDDPAKVYRLIEKSETLLKGIDENTRAAGMDINKEEIAVQIDQLMRSVVNAACYPFYRDGVIEMDQGNYLEAIDLFYQAYEIYPGYLNGINIYNLGKSYAGAGMVSEANEAFNFVIDNYPGTDLEGWARGRLIPED